MNVVSLTGNDTINIDGRVIVDVADGNCGELAFPNEIAKVKTGKNGNALYALDESGRQCKHTLRVVRGSDDDKFLQAKLNAQMNNFAGTVLMKGQFVKKVGDGAGNISNDTYTMSGGIFTNQVDAKSNVEGDVDQSVSVYKMTFSNAPRTIG